MIFLKVLSITLFVLFNGTMLYNLYRYRREHADGQ